MIVTVHEFFGDTLSERYTFGTTLDTAPAKQVEQKRNLMAHRNARVEK